jgi:hypothetical protein
MTTFSVIVFLGSAGNTADHQSAMNQCNGLDHSNLSACVCTNCQYKYGDFENVPWWSNDPNVGHEPMFKLSAARAPFHDSAGRSCALNMLQSATGDF